jgi:hypothetical protein
MESFRLSSHYVACLLSVVCLLIVCLSVCKMLRASCNVLRGGSLEQCFVAALAAANKNCCGTESGWHANGERRTEMCMCIHIICVLARLVDTVYTHCLVFLLELFNYSYYSKIPITEKLCLSFSLTFLLLRIFNTVSYMQWWIQYVLLRS